VIPETLAGVRYILESAAKQPSVRHFVYTSSSAATTAPKPNVEFKITTETWNQEDIDAAWAPPPYLDDRKWAVYGASKAKGEQEVWMVTKEKKPHFIANTILPNTILPNANFGLILDKDEQASMELGSNMSTRASMILLRTFLLVSSPAPSRPLSRIQSTLTIL